MAVDFYSINVRYLGVMSVAFCLSAIAIFGVYTYSPTDKTLFFDTKNWDPVLIRRIETGPVYLNPDLILTIDSPQSSSSEQTKKEIDYLHTAIKKRTQEKTAQIESENGDIIPLFLLQAGIDGATKPETLNLMKIVSFEAGYFILREKWKFQRARPYEVDPTLSTVIPHPPHASYPSGHAGQSRAIALLLSALDAKHKDVWVMYGEGVGVNREIAGVHFPSDTEAGVEVANQIMNKLFENSRFLAEFNRVIELEWKSD